VLQPEATLMPKDVPPAPLPPPKSRPPASCVQSTPDDVELGAVVVEAQFDDGRGQFFDNASYSVSLDANGQPSQAQPVEPIPAELGSGAVLGSPMFRPVSQLPIGIQAAFRWKMLMLLFLQLVFTLGVAVIFRWGATDTIHRIFKTQSVQALALMVGVATGIPGLSVVKDRHPWNLIFTVLWSVVFGLFVAVSDLPGAYFKSHALFVIMFQLTGGVFFLLLFSSIKGRNEYDDPMLWTFSRAGTISWLLYIIGSSIIYGMTLTSDTTPAHYVTCSIMSTLVFSWICYDAGSLCKKMSPDDYMKGVIHFYTDLLFVCLCCAFIACMGSSGANAQ